MKQVLIIGIGQTGASIARFCERTNQSSAAWEPDRHAKTAAFQSAFPQITLWQGDLPPEAYDIPLWVLSPGIPLTQPEIIKAKEKNIDITGDVTLFLQHNTKPILAVTGSNGKSTVVSLLDKMIEAVGLRSALLGNIGTPVLDGLEKTYDVAILELSSFQLDITSGLNATVACVLNVTPDHLDRHGSMAAYTASKKLIYVGAKHVVCNADDPATDPHRQDAVYFSMSSHDKNVWHVENHAIRYRDKHYDVARLPIHSDIHIANVMAALAMIQCAGFDTDKAFEAACAFHGLPHRLVMVLNKNHIQWFDDSKATNIGATEASIDSVSKLITGKIVIILGGLAKGASFVSLRVPLAAHGRAAILMGEAKDQLAEELAGSIPCVRAQSLREAVDLANQHAQPNDAVLLAPACASYDMFKNYGDRGDQFTALVKERMA